jgi:DNA-binding transcriptional regulator YiaG
MSKKKAFHDLRNSLKDALAYEQGHALNLRVTELPSRPRMLKPQEIRQIRIGLNATQVIFASFLNVHPNTVRSWEQGSRKPRAADLKLLRIAKENPRALLS